MKFEGHKHNRGIHCLKAEPDHQILARARIKGMSVHPAIVKTQSHQLNASFVSKIRRGLI